MIYSRLCSFILHSVLGWHAEVTFPFRDKAIICVAPHTSNADFFIARLFYASKNRTARFLMKKEWFVWPISIWLHHIGGIPVWRDKKTSLTDRLAAYATSHDKFELAITPEGTRSLTAEWKKGFYYIALKAKLPIQLYALDYERKMIVGTKELIPSGDIDTDMRDIKLYYSNFKGRHPEKFTIGKL